MIRFFKLMAQCAFLYLLCIIGDAIHLYTQLPLPGSLTGMIILFMLLTFKVIPLRWINDGAMLLLSVMTLFLVPSTVGIMNYGTFFMHEGLILLGITVVSTIIVFFLAGHAGQYFATRKVHVSLKKRERSL